MKKRYSRVENKTLSRQRAKKKIFGGNRDMALFQRVEKKTVEGRKIIDFPGEVIVGLCLLEHQEQELLSEEGYLRMSSSTFSSSFCPRLTGSTDGKRMITGAFLEAQIVGF